MIYDKIKALARDKGVTVMQMEKDLNLPARDTCKWNKVTPSIFTLKKVADYFGVTVDELIT